MQLIKRDTPAVAPTPERCVLCVDDDHEFLKSLEYFLPEQINRGLGQTCSYRFVFCTEPSDALAQLQELVDDGEIVAMLISDQQMPNMRGTELLARARELVPDAIRVLLTGHAGIDAAITAINEQLLDRYLTKPIESEQDFMLSVRNLLEAFEMKRRLAQQGTLIHGLFAFANALNASEDVDTTLGRVVEFTRSTLVCDHVRIALAPTSSDPDAHASPRGAEEPAASNDGPRRRPDVGTVPRVEDCPWLDVMVPGADVAWPPGSVAYAALRSGERDLGLILAWQGVAGPPFTADSLAALRHIAASASIALQHQLSRARLAEIAETRARHLEEARARLVILDRLKADFLNFVSHEIRTPLNYMAAIGLIDGDMNPDHANMVRIVREGYVRFERFIMSSLEYFEWYAARPDDYGEGSDVRAVVIEVAQQKHSWDGTPLALEIAAADAPCPVAVPRHCAETLVGILVDNAIKFANGEPRVRIAIDTRPGWVTLTLSDQGRGFPPEWADEIFRPFTITNVLNHHEGTALNLAKVAAMVEAYGGRIRASSLGLNQGATFTVDLPAREGEQARVLDVKTGNARPGDGESDSDGYVAEAA